jgi:hypothetical protein
MQYICDAPNRKTWFRIESEAEALQESALMRHAVEKYFRRERDKAVQTYKPVSVSYIERDIGLNAHLQREMPLFLTLRDAEGEALATAMLPAAGKPDPKFAMIVVGPDNADPYAAHEDAIKALGAHFKLSLPRDRCFPYRR